MEKIILFIDTASEINERFLELKSGEQTIARKKFIGQGGKSHVVLKVLEEMLTEHKLNIKDIQEIKVNNRGKSFTALRVGVTTANTLSYALSVPISAISDKKTQIGQTVVARYLN